MKKSTLFAILPDYISTPDGMAIDRHGNLVLSCPNFAEEQTSGCVVRFDREKHCQKWFDVPVHPQTGVARPMGIAFDRDYNLYICDNQGWSGQEHLAFQGRDPSVTADEKGSAPGGLWPLAWSIPTGSGSGGSISMSPRAA